MHEIGILIIDDNQPFCTGLERRLHAQGYRKIRTAMDGSQALELIASEHPDLVLMDLYLPGMDGMHLLRAIHKIDRGIPIIMLTGEADEECHKVAERLGAFDYLVKPLEFSVLFASMDACLRAKSQQNAT